MLKAGPVAGFSLNSFGSCWCSRGRTTLLAFSTSQFYHIWNSIPFLLFNGKLYGLIQLKLVNYLEDSGSEALQKHKT